MNTYKVRVLDSKEFYLKHQVDKPKIIISKINGIYPRLEFITYYIPLVDEEGHYPPKYLISSNIIFDLVDEKLRELNLSKEYECYSELYLDDIEMETVYVSDSKIDIEITCEELKSYKWTMFRIPIERRISSNSDDTNSDTDIEFNN